MENAALSPHEFINQLTAKFLDTSNGLNHFMAKVTDAFEAGVTRHGSVAGYLRNDSNPANYQEGARHMASGFNLMLPSIQAYIDNPYLGASGEYAAYATKALSAIRGKYIRYFNLWPEYTRVGKDLNVECQGVIDTLDSCIQFTEGQVTALGLGLGVGHGKQ